jgi:signal transduction histidine kinase
MIIFGKKKQTDPQERRDGSQQGRESGHFFREVDIEFLIHELKDPVAIIETGIRTLLEREEKYGPLTAKQKKTLERSLRNSKKARGMLNNLLEIGRSQSGCFLPCRFKPADAAFRALSDSLEAMAWKLFEQFAAYDERRDALAFLSRSGIVFAIDPPAQHTEMMQDETKFCQIVGNLIKNAIHHRQEHMDVVLRQEDDRLFIDISDDGPGIDAENQHVIFERYTRLKECALTPREGHGLGLAGARILARCMGGEIEVKSEKGQGTTFQLMLPLTMQAR